VSKSHELHLKNHKYYHQFSNQSEKPITFHKHSNQMKKSITIIITILTLNASAQKTPTEEAQPIVAEGKLLYKSEMASWYGTDLFLEKYKNRDHIGGYFPYIDKDIAKCIFFSNAGNPTVIGTISFDNSFNVQTAKTDLTERAFSRYENDIYTIRKIALAEVNADTMFKSYEKMNLNFIPLITGNEKKVYILTGPEENGVVIFGNDYLLTFDKDNQLISKKQLHKNIIPIYYGGKEADGKTIEGAMHSHLPETGDFITATDICTLMLYEKFAKWKTHQVISEKYINIWNCETDVLAVLARETIEKINKDQGTGKKKKEK